MCEVYSGLSIIISAIIIILNPSLNLASNPYSGPKLYGKSLCLMFSIEKTYADTIQILNNCMQTLPRVSLVDKESQAARRIDPI